MSFNSDYNIVTIIAVSAIFSPVLVTAIDHCYNYFKYKYEVKKAREDAKDDYISKLKENYLISIGTLSGLSHASIQGVESLEKYKRAYYALHPHVNEKTRQFMFEINKLANDFNWGQIDALLDPLVNEMYDK